jgi:hypothetical protein
MGAKTWMLVTAEGSVRDALASNPALDRGASIQFAQNFFPEYSLTPIDDGDLYYTNPPDSQVFAGVYDNVKIAAASEFGIDYPSKLPRRYISPTGTTTLHAMHSVVDWFAFAHWVDGQLVRSLSLSPDSGILEDIGDRLEFEQPYWQGQHPAVEDDEDEYAFIFHPLGLGEATLLAFFGYQIEGYVENNLINPESFPLLHFNRRRNRRWWQFWK